MNKRDEAKLNANDVWENRRVSQRSLKAMKRQKQASKEANMETDEMPLEELKIADPELQESEDNIPKKHKARSKAWITTWILCLLVWMLVVCAVGGGIFAWKLGAHMLEGTPELTSEALASANSTIIYDSEGTVIAELGEYIRENVTYESIPNVTIDAFLAIEDSRFFTHFGFDVPRFAAAALSNLRSGDFGQGGSTITMQLIKNSYFQVDAGDDSTIAAREGTSGVVRKAQEISLAVAADQNYSKQEIITYFLNKINFGNNVRGIEKAAQYYFGKSVSKLNLVESAFLAGIINAPNYYNAYNDTKKGQGNIYIDDDTYYLTNANARKNEVLNLMLAHGYIDEIEHQLGINTDLADLLKGEGTLIVDTEPEYQSFVDAVIDEAYKVTGLDPYYNSMEIYTTMDAHMQEYVYKLQNNKIDEYHTTYSNDRQQSAIVCLNNQTGELVALGGGRGQSGSRQYNRATSAYIQPGSTVKPIFEYLLGFEWLGWATTHTITDQPVYLYNSRHLISNMGGGYTGDMLITEAVGRSLNSPAIQALMAVVDEKGEEACVDYLNSIGFEVEYEDFNLQYALGGSTFIVTPVQLASAHGVLMNGGRYIAPHTISKITFGEDTGLEDYVADTAGEQVISEAAAYLAAYLERYNVASNPWGGFMKMLDIDFPIHSKTGTSDWGDSGLSYGIPEGANKDEWNISQTSQYTCAVWVGYDKLEEGAYFTMAEHNYNQKGYWALALHTELMNHFKYDAHEIEQPDSVVSITHIKGVFPYCYPTSGTSITGLIKKEYANLVDISTIERTTKKSTLTGMAVSFTSVGDMNITWQGFSSGCVNGVMDISATNAYGETTRATGRCYYNRFNFINPSTYYVEIYMDGSLIGTKSSSHYSTTVEMPKSSNVTTTPSPTTSPDPGSPLPVPTATPTPTFDWKSHSWRVCGYTSSDSTKVCTETVGGD